MTLEEVYREAFSRFNSDRILFRGFLLEKNFDGTVSFKDIRTLYYREVDKKLLPIFLERGFEQGATYLLMQSDSRKIDRYNRLIANKQNLLEVTDNPRKQMEHLNAIARYTSEINYYESQVRRWQQFIKNS